MSLWPMPGLAGQTRLVRISGAMLATATFLCVLSGCSSAPTVDSTSGVSVAPSNARLPGETYAAATQRVLYACMDALNETNYQALKGKLNGVDIALRGYDQSNPDTKRHFDDCTKKAQAAVPLPKQTKERLLASHAQLVRLVGCLRDGGFDVGTPPSADEFVAKGGDISASSRWESAQQLPGFQDALNRCSLLYPPPDA